MQPEETRRVKNAAICDFIYQPWSLPQSVSEVELNGTCEGLLARNKDERCRRRTWSSGVVPIPERA